VEGEWEGEELEEFVQCRSSSTTYLLPLYKSPSSPHCHRVRYRYYHHLMSSLYPQLNLILTNPLLSPPNPLPSPDFRNIKTAYFGTKPGCLSLYQDLFPNTPLVSLREVMEWEGEHMESEEVEVQGYITDISLSPLNLNLFSLLSFPPPAFKRRKMGGEWRNRLRGEERKKVYSWDGVSGDVVEITITISDLNLTRSLSDITLLLPFHIPNCEEQPEELEEFVVETFVEMGVVERGDGTLQQLILNLRTVKFVFLVSLFMQQHVSRTIPAIWPL